MEKNDDTPPLFPSQNSTGKKRPKSNNSRAAAAPLFFFPRNLFFFYPITYLWGRKGDEGFVIKKKVMRVRVVFLVSFSLSLWGNHSMYKDEGIFLNKIVLVLIRSQIYRIIPFLLLLFSRKEDGCKRGFPEKSEYSLMCLLCVICFFPSILKMRSRVWRKEAQAREPTSRVYFQLGMISYFSIALVKALSLSHDIQRKYLLEFGGGGGRIFCLQNHYFSSHLSFSYFLPCPQIRNYTLYL